MPIYHNALKMEKTVIYLKIWRHQSWFDGLKYSSHNQQLIPKNHEISNNYIKRSVHSVQPHHKKVCFLCWKTNTETLCAAGNPGLSLGRHKTCDGVKRIENIPTNALLITRSPAHKTSICRCWWNCQCSEGTHGYQKCIYLF